MLGEKRVSCGDKAVVANLPVRGRLKLRVEADRVLHDGIFRQALYNLQSAGQSVPNPFIEPCSSLSHSHTHTQTQTQL